MKLGDRKIGNRKVIRDGSCAFSDGVGFYDVSYEKARDFARAFSMKLKL